MTYGELISIQTFLRGLFEEKKLEITELRKQAEKDPSREPNLAYAMGQYYRLKSLTETVSHDLTRLQGIGPGDLFARASSPPAKDTAIADAINALNATLTRIYFRSHFG